MDESFKHIVLVGKSLFSTSLHKAIKAGNSNVCLGGLWAGKKRYSGMATTLLDFKAPFKADFVQEASLVIVYMSFIKAVRWLKSSQTVLAGKTVVVLGAPFILDILAREGLCRDVNVIEADIPAKGYNPEKKFILPDKIHFAENYSISDVEKEKLTLFFKSLNVEVIWQTQDIYIEDIMGKSIIPRLIVAETIMRQRRIKKEKRQPIVLPEILFIDNISVDTLFLKKKEIIFLLKDKGVDLPKTIRALACGHKKLLCAIYKNRNLKS